MRVISNVSVVSTLRECKEFSRADPYSIHPKKIRAIEKIKEIAEKRGWDIVKLGDLLKIPPSSGRSGLPVDPNGVVKIVKPANLTSLFFVDLTSCERTTIEAYMSSEKGRLEDEDILVLSAAHAEGYIGTNTSIVRLSKEEKAICIGEIIRLRPNSEKINPYYLVIFLNSLIGRYMLNYSVRGQTAHLYPKDIRHLPILVPPRDIQDSIGDKLKQAIEAKIEAEKKRKEIEEIFKSHFGELNIKKHGGYTFNISQCIEESRLDPHYFYPEFIKAIKRIRESGFEVRELSELFEFSKETIDPSKFDKFIYVEIADIDLTYGFISKHSVIEGKKAPSRARKVIHKDYLLVPLTRPYRGAIAVVDDRYDGAVATTGFSVLYPKRDALVDSYYLCAFLKSPWGIVQLTQKMSNANYPAILESDIAKVLVPILPEGERKKISENMKKIVINLISSKQFHAEAMNELNKLLELNSEGDIYEI